MRRIKRKEKKKREREGVAHSPERGDRHESVDALSVAEGELVRGVP